MSRFQLRPIYQPIRFLNMVKKYANAKLILPSFKRFQLLGNTVRQTLMRMQFNFLYDEKVQIFSNYPENN